MNDRSGVPRWLLRGLVFLAVASGGGCGRWRVVDYDGLVHRLGVDPGNNVRYMGSDEGYHYFVNYRGLRSFKLRVSTSKLEVKRSFPYGKGETYVVSRYSLTPLAGDPNP